MNFNTIENIREEFRMLKHEDKRIYNTYEIRNAVFRVNDNTIFGSPNYEYIKAEIEWYESQSLYVQDLFDIYGKPVKIWNDVASSDGRINSNYGWCIYSKENGTQYEYVKEELEGSPFSRRAVMIYTRPNMHCAQNDMGMGDFMCTTHVQYFVTKGHSKDYLDASVHMRSNDAVFGFMNDVAWQQHVLYKLSNDLNLLPGLITWNAGSLHVYDRHWDLI